MSNYRPQIIKDTREKNNWVIGPDHIFGPMLNIKLNEGDYSLTGYDTVIIVERKGAVTEYAANCISERFDNELERLKKYKYAYLLFEFDMDDLINYPKNIKYANNFKVSGHFLLRKTIEYQLTYGVIPIFAGRHGENVLYSIFKRFLAQNYEF